MTLPLEDGFLLLQPSVFVPWSTTREQLKTLCPVARFGHPGLKEVTRRYYVLSDVASIAGTAHELGFHFSARGELAKFELFRRNYSDLAASYAEFQENLEQALGAPTLRENGSEGFDRCVWRWPSVEVLHEIMDRFGPEEHVWITRLPSRVMLA